MGITHGQKQAIFNLFDKHCKKADEFMNKRNEAFKQGKDPLVWEAWNEAESQAAGAVWDVIEILDIDEEYCKERRND